MPREFTTKDIEIFNKLAPEAGNKLISKEAGHQFPFILRPISHKFAESPEDFRERLRRLNTEDLDYLVDLVLEGKEDIQSMVDEDLEELIKEIFEKLPPERGKQLKDFLEIH